MRIFITGATGFIGSRLVPELVKQHEVYALVREDAFLQGAHLPDDVILVRGDLLNVDLAMKLKAIRPEIVIHLAGLTPVRYSFSKPLEYGEVNYFGTVNLIEAIKELKVKQYIHASTMEVYRAKDGPLVESDALEGGTPYGVSKAAADLYVQVAGRAWKIPYTILRPANTFGRPMELPEEAKGYLVEKAVIGMLTQPVVEFDGWPDRVRSWLYYPDHISAYLSVAGNEKALFKIYNVSAGAYSVGQIVAMIKEITGFKGEIRWGKNPRPYDPPVLFSTAEKIKLELGWSPRYSIRQGLEATVKYWIERLSK